MSDNPEVQEALKSLLRNLLDVREQRLASLHQRSYPTIMARRRGELWGLDIAIQAVKRRLQ